jgi:hypothetical protein
MTWLFAMLGYWRFIYDGCTQLDGFLRLDVPATVVLGSVRNCGSSSSIRTARRYRFKKPRLKKPLHG